MKCKNCGQELGEGVKICPICKMQQMAKGHWLGKHSLIPADGGIVETDSEVDVDFNQSDSYPYSPRSKVTAGLLQIFLGGFGIGRFYLGYNGIALGQLFTFPIFFIGAIWGFIDGILILCGQVPYDANGVPVK